LNVIERAEPGRDWACPEPYTDCAEDYLSLPARAAVYARPVERASLVSKIAAIHAGEVPLVEEALSPRALSSVVRGALNIDFLLDGLDARRLEVIHVREIPFRGYTEHRYILVDPWVGELFAVLLVPDTDGAPHPVIMTVHGHGQRADSPLDFMFGRTFAERGYAVFSMTYRVMNADRREREVTEALLLAGFSFETVRIYETLLGLKYLRAREDLGEVGVLAHSGGASANNLAAWLGSPMAAYVYDLEPTYYGAMGDRWTDEMVPDLFPYHPQINAIQGSGIPSLRVPYGFEDEFDEILGFMNENLQR